MIKFFKNITTNLSEWLKVFLSKDSLRQYLIRIFLFLITVTASYNLLINFSTQQSLGNSKEVLGLLVKVIAVIVAVIVSYLFAKLFSERQERIGRKREIDKLAKKFFLLQRLSHRIRSSHRFWQIKGDYNPKQIIDFNYKHLTLSSYRYDERPYETQVNISSHIRSTAGQGYLGLKGLENRENALLFFQEFNLRNFTIEQIRNFKECASFFHTFLDKYQNGDDCFNRMHPVDKDYIDGLYFRITNRKVDKSQFGNDITDLYSDFSYSFFDNLYYLTDLNNAPISKLFSWALQNAVMSLMLLIMSLFVLVLDISITAKYVSTLFAVSVFVGNAVDLVAIIFIAVRTELKIEKIYEI